MRVLILGVAGMLGHKLYQRFEQRYSVMATVRGQYEIYAPYSIFHPDHFITNVDAQKFETVVQAVEQSEPDVIINCIGIIKQLPSAKDPLVSIAVNSLFPHQLAHLCHASGTRLIHISTDCVFSGQRGMYRESDPSDAEDLYGRTKFLGEVDVPGCLTLRTSIIGRELHSCYGLVEWFLSNRGKRICGYSRAIYTGFPTTAMADIIADLIDNWPDLSGLYQVSSDPVNKYELLLLLRDAYDVSVDIDDYPDVEIDRSLDSTRFRTTTGFQPRSWTDMVLQMANDPTNYETQRT